MNNTTIINQASQYATAITALMPNETTQLHELFHEIKAWFESIPSERIDDRVLVRKYACYSHYYRWTEQYADVFRCVVEIADINPMNEDSIYCGWIYRNASRVANFLGMVNESIEYGYKAIDMTEKSQIQSEICKCYNLIGGSFNIIELYDVAFDFYKKAYKIATDIGSLPSQMISLNNMGYNRILVKDFNQAERLLLKAKRLIGSERTRLDLHIQINNNLATVALHNHNFEEAHDYIARAKHYNSLNKLTSDAISILQVESDIYREEGKPAETIRTLMTALELANEKKLERYALKVEKAIANALTQEGRFEEATQHLQQSLALQEKFTQDLAQSHLQVVHYELEVRKSRAILERRLQQTITTISKIGELRDVYTAGHQRRVKDLACAIAREIGLSESAIMNLSYGCLIHDIGKIYIASDILNKPGVISSLEYQILQTHSEYGYNVVKEVDFPDVIPLMIHQHHERLDGSGYPQGLSGDQIILESRILAVADVVEAMSSHRPYRPALGIEAALNEITAAKGIKYDSVIVEACVDLFREKGFKFEA